MPHALPTEEVAELSELVFAFAGNSPALVLLDLPSLREVSSVLPAMLRGLAPRSTLVAVVDAKRVAEINGFAAVTTLPLLSDFIAAMLTGRRR